MDNTVTGVGESGADEQLLGRRISRRQVMKGFGMAAVGTAGGALLGAFGQGSLTSYASRRPLSSSARLGAATLAFSWIDDVQQAGSYIAQQRGYYLDAGLAVSFLPGGDTYAGEPLVVSGKALLAMTSPASTAAAHLQGAPVTIVGAQYQKSPVSIISLASAPIRTPAELVGKKIAVEPNIELEWKAFETANGLTGKVDSFVTSESPSLLAAGGCQGYTGWTTNEAVALEVQGVHVHTMLFADNGLPGYYLTYCADTNVVRDPHGREQIKAMLTGEIRGWQVQVSRPSVGLALTLDDYGKHLGLNPKQQQIQAVEQNLLIESPVTKAHGLFWMSAADTDAMLKSLKLAGTAVPASLFDNSLLAEVYAGKSALA
jgi:ABC-type nitrate/sulfonate/bicarbonate transport system substrate-binding protein